MRCFRTRGKKGELHYEWHYYGYDPPRRRANKRKGHGTYANDRPPVLGTVGRESGQVRLRVVKDTTGQTLRGHVHQFTAELAQVYTDEWVGYNGLRRAHATVCHSIKEWARDDDGDGIREVHTNTTEGMWASVRTFLRPFRGVHKRYLSGYIAMCEFSINLKRISPAFISALVALPLHPFQT
jgi:transposase-like protein